MSSGEVPTPDYRELFGVAAVTPEQARDALAQLLQERQEEFLNFEYGSFDPAIAVDAILSAREQVLVALRGFKAAKDLHLNYYEQEAWWFPVPSTPDSKET